MALGGALLPCVVWIDPATCSLYVRGVRSSGSVKTKVTGGFDVSRELAANTPEVIAVRSSRPRVERVAMALPQSIA